jgi:hypothetical protein
MNGNDGMLSLIVFRLSDLSDRARVTADLLAESRDSIDLPPDQAGQVLADLGHLAAELDAISSVLGAAVDPQGQERAAV